jgi:hypothetical protein
LIDIILLAGQLLLLDHYYCYLNPQYNYLLPNYYLFEAPFFWKLHAIGLLAWVQRPASSNKASTSMGIVLKKIDKLV